MKIFAIIVNYNGWKDTYECVDSLRNLNLTHLNIVVVDNKSIDGESIEMLNMKKKAGEIELILSPVNGGFSHGNNIGIRYALKNEADYIILINNDTIVADDFISPLIEILNRNQNCGAISPRINFYYDKNKIWYDGGTFNKLICRARHYRFEEYQTTSKGCLSTNFITGCCIILPAKVINDVGLFDERFFLYGEDTEYSLRLKKAGYELAWDADYVLYHKVSSSTGRFSKRTQYYQIRNNLIIGNMYQNMFERLVTRCYDKFFYFYKVLFKGYDYKIVRRAIDDFKKGIVGKVDI